MSRVRPEHVRQAQRFGRQPVIPYDTGSGPQSPAPATNGGETMDPLTRAHLQLARAWRPDREIGQLPDPEQAQARALVVIALELAELRKQFESDNGDDIAQT